MSQKTRYKKSPHLEGCICQICTQPVPKGSPKYQPTGRPSGKSHQRRIVRRARERFQKALKGFYSSINLFDLVPSWAVIQVPWDENERKPDPFTVATPFYDPFFKYEKAG